MKSRLAIVLLAVSAVHACAKKSQDAPSASIERPSQAAQKPQASRADAGAGPAVQGKPEALPPLAPFADGKRVRIKPLEDGIKALEITVPPNFKLKYEGGEEMAPSAHLVGPDLEIEVAQPEAGFFTLKERMKTAMNSERPPTFFRAEETEDGFLLVERNWLTGDHPLYIAVVSRPKLKVECVAAGLEKLSDADLVASICLTLRAAPPKPRN